MSRRGDFAQSLARRAREGGNTVVDIARLCRVSRQSVHAWLRGQPARNAALRRLAEIVVLDEDEEALMEALTHGKG